MLVTHFGNGDEIDQDILIDFCKTYGGPLKSLNIFPGSNFGHLEFQDLSSAELLMKCMDNRNCKNLEFTGSENVDRTVVFFYTPLKCQELKKSVNIEVPISEIATSGSIPGLYIYDDFISEEEEKELVKGIDAGKWVKLLNRRV